MTVRSLGLIGAAAPLPGRVAATPELAPGMRRRTSHADLLRPGGLADPRLVVTSAAQDFIADAEGSPRAPGGTWSPALDGAEPRVMDSARLTAEVTYDGTRELTALQTDPAQPGTDVLLGRSVGRGFRAAAVPLAAAGSVLALLLDELPVAMVIAGYAHALTKALPPGAARYQPALGLCSGWREDGTMAAAVAAGDPVPLKPGPPAPPTSYPQLPPLGMRRQRRIDVRPESDEVFVQAMFRDTYVDPDGLETVLHEYEMDAVLDAATLTVQSVTAVPRVLPAPECPMAAASAGRLVGVAVAELPREVGRDLRGTSTCTHLNDLFRSLGGIPTLLGRA